MWELPSAHWATSMSSQEDVFWGFLSNGGDTGDLAIFEI